MTALYLKATHIIFIVTWFAALFYMPRLLIYMREAFDKSEPEKSILLKNFSIMASRLWFGIAWPSAVITLGLGIAMLIEQPHWLQQSFMHLKLSLVFFLYLYHLSIQYVFHQLKKGSTSYTSGHLRLWNEVATLFLISIVFLIVLKNALSMVWGIIGLLIITLFIMVGIRFYKKFRE